MQYSTIDSRLIDLNCRKGITNIEESNYLYNKTNRMKSLILVLLLLSVFAQGQIRNVMAQHPVDEPSMENLEDGIVYTK